MTRHDAITWMKLGARCEHRFFGTGEWVTIDEAGMYVLEDGVRCTSDEFWKWRAEAYWDCDWEFAKGYDPYICIAAREYSVTIDEVTSSMRSTIKRKYFTLMYHNSRF